MEKIKEAQLKKLLKSGGRKGAEDDFLELLKRSVRYNKLIKKAKS